MKKTLLITLIMAVTLVSTACVNKFAVQELNNNAQKMLAAGDVEGAISRLESSIDLDESLYETHYNLAVAYLEAKKLDKAEKALNKVFELNPDFPDAYHTMGVVNEEKAYEIINGKDSEEDNDNAEVSDDVQAQENALTDEQKTDINKYITTAIEYYNKYLSKKVNADDAAKVNEKIDSLNTELRKYSTEESGKSERVD